MRIIIALLLFAACRGDSRQDMPRPDQLIGGNIVPRSHQIPAGHISEVRRLFDTHVISYPISVISEKGVQTQFVNPQPAFLGSDRFVVGATPEIHAELDQLLATIAKSPPSPGPATYEVTYWVVEATSGEAPVPPELADVAPALEALAGLGKRKLKQIDRVATLELTTETSELRGQALYIWNQLSAEPDGLRLNLKLQLENRKIETQLQVQPDKVIVLGDSANTDSSSLTLYLVRVRRVV